MAKMSKEERAELEARLAADDDDDEDDEVEVGFSDGSYVRGRYSRVSKAASARGVKLEPDPVDPDAPTAGGKSGKTTGGSNSNVKRFQSGRRVS